jgi:hypothetical protein
VDAVLGNRVSKVIQMPKIVSDLEPCPPLPETKAQEIISKSSQRLIIIAAL